MIFKKFHDQSAELMKEYNQKLKDWEDKMVLEGKEKLIYKSHLQAIRREKRKNMQTSVNVKTRLLAKTMKKANKVKKNYKQRKFKSISSVTSECDKNGKRSEKINQRIFSDQMSPLRFCFIGFLFLIPISVLIYF